MSTLRFSNWEVGGYESTPYYPRFDSGCVYVCVSFRLPTSKILRNRILESEKSYSIGGRVKRKAGR